MSEEPRNNQYKKLTDEELVRLSLENKENFYHLIKRYEWKLLRYIHRLTDITQQESEDVLQDIFIKVYCNLNGFNQNLKFSSSSVAALMMEFKSRDWLRLTEATMFTMLTLAFTLDNVNSLILLCTVLCCNDKCFG